MYSAVGVRKKRAPIRWKCQPWTSSRLKIVLYLPFFVACANFGSGGQVLVSK